MKTILFDFMTLQYPVSSGVNFYTEKVFNELIKRDVHVYGLYDGKKEKFAMVERILENNKIELIDIHCGNLNKEITDKGIDAVFIGATIINYYYDFSKINCEMYIVLHDLVYSSVEYSGIHRSKLINRFLIKYYERRGKSQGFRKFIRSLLSPWFCINHRRSLAKDKALIKKNIKPLFPLDNVHILTDSEYSKYAIEYFLGSSRNEIEVFYAPLKEKFNLEAEEGHRLHALKDQKYFLMISANRYLKNAKLVIDVWEKFNQKTNGEYKLVLVGNRIKADLENCITFDNVNTSELEYLLKNAFSLLYPSFAEGFGYPPIEAAAYGTPSICSNVTSIPEICGDMPIYFSPFYPEDLYRAMIEMTKNREFYAKKTQKRFLEVQDRQESDLNKLIQLITN